MLETAQPRSRCASALEELAAAAADFVALDEERWPTYEHLHHAALAAVHAICLAVLRCEESGCSREEIVDVLAPVRDIHGRSPFVARLTHLGLSPAYVSIIERGGNV